MFPFVLVTEVVRVELPIGRLETLRFEGGPCHVHSLDNDRTCYCLAFVIIIIKPHCSPYISYRILVERI